MDLRSRSGCRNITRNTGVPERGVTTLEASDLWRTKGEYDILRQCRSALAASRFRIWRAFRTRSKSQHLRYMKHWPSASGTPRQGVGRRNSARGQRQSIDSRRSRRARSEAVGLHEMVGATGRSFTARGKRTSANSGNSRHAGFTVSSA